MSVFRYSTYKIRIDPDSNKTQGLQTGDIVRRQYTGRDRAVYSLMVVLEAGVETVGDKEAPYFIGALLDGDEPQNGELLDFVRVTSLFDSSRSGALYLTASDGSSLYGRYRRHGKGTLALLSRNGGRHHGRSRQE